MEGPGAASLVAWRAVHTMLDDMTTMVTETAETELELLEGLRVLGRITALCAELSLDVDPEAPWFFSMNSAARYVGGPNPDGAYHLAMIDGRHRYVVSGARDSSTYVGFQVLAGTGLTPRTMATYVSDRDLDVDGEGNFAFVLASGEPSAADLGGRPWVPVPEDASSIVVRQYVADPLEERLATFEIQPLETPGPVGHLTDEVLAEQFTAMAWTIWKLATLHQTIKPELLDMPNELITAEAADLGAADTTPDNLYMIGTFRLGEQEALVLEFSPPDTRYWSVTAENIWHECIDVRRRPSSLTNAEATASPEGTVQVILAAHDPGFGNWIDTGGRHRGFVVLRWLDNPQPPTVSTTVVTKGGS